MPTETRYFRSDTHTINGLLAYKLLTSQSAVEANKYEYNTAAYFRWGIRVWKRTSGGAETEITSGTPVAVVTRTIVAEGMQSNTWACPETALVSTDAIIVRVYIYELSAWRLKATYITEVLGAGTLDANTWTVYYYTRLMVFGIGFRGVFYFGINVPKVSPYDSRITGFKWTIPVVKVRAGLNIPQVLPLIIG